MAKDRFSNQKRSVYDAPFRYGIDPLIEKRVQISKIVKPVLEKKYKKKLKKLKQNKQLTGWEYNFVMSILETNRCTSIKQRAIIQKIETDCIKRNEPKIIYNNPESKK